MPASRSRTENWRRTLEQIHDRNGALEITLPQPGDNESGDALDSAQVVRASHLIWRVRIVSLSADEILIEEPAALGKTIHLEDGLELVGIIALGQNRWMFRTRVLGRKLFNLNSMRRITALRLAMPDAVERCQRRNFYRVSTIGLHLPVVECYPVIDPASVMLAETANRLQITELLTGAVAGSIGKGAESEVLPQVGPSFSAKLVNLGGGGVGLLVNPRDRGALEARPLLWLRIGLAPHVPAPLGVAARIRHTHIDSAQNIYAGMAFDFTGNAEHQKFVVDQLCRCVAMVQRDQLRRLA